MKKLYCLFLLSVTGLQTNFLQAQVAISTTPATPDPSAMLDIKSNTKGILVPRTSTSSRTGIVNPAKGLMVYDTSTGSFWFHNGSAWTEVSNTNTVWNMKGNINTDPAVNFIGTTDAMPLNVRVNNQPAGRIDPDLFNTSWGFQALAVATGSQNTATGYQSLYSNTSGVRNTAYGCYSLSVNSTGSSNTAGGYQSMYVNTSGSANTAYGSNTLFHNTTGAENSASGYQALFFNTTGFNNSAFGYQALFNNSTGYYNTAAGDFALADNTTGINNTAMGSSSLGNNSTGHDNTASGNEALAINSIGNYNTSMGSASLFSNTSGGFNTALGDATLYNNTTGSHNTALGNQSGPNTGLGNLSYTAAIGSNATVNCSNCLVLGGTTAGGAQTKVGINNSTPVADLHIIQQSNADLDNSRGIELQQSGGGNQWRTFIDPSNNYILQYNNNIYGYIDPVGASYHNFSDRRLKKDIQPISYVLKKVLQLKAVSYHYTKNNDTDPRLYGFVAQQVEKIFPDFVSTAGNGYKGIAYNNFSVVAIQAIQEQQQLINELKKQNELRQKQYEELKKEIELIKYKK